MKHQIERTGQISFGDASISIGEEGPGQRSSWEERSAWELAFKRQVFARVVQTLNRLGWTCTVPAASTKQDSPSLARTFRDCSKEDLKGELQICGRSITLKMWQGVNTPRSNRHDPRTRRLQPHPGPCQQDPGR
jgi:hypothetical protein